MLPVRRMPGSWLAVAALWFSLATASVAQQSMVIVGSGTSLTISLYQEWATQFNANNGHIQVRYVPLGSSEGIRQISAGTGDFGAGEIPLTDAQMHGSQVSLLLVPTALVGIVPIYNVPGNPQLNFSGDLLAQIYLGRVQNWSDPQIAKLNPGLKLPDLPILVVYRGPGRGSNYIFTDFLSKTSAQFRAEVGRSASPSWPRGVESDRGQDMLERVISTRGAVGYVDMSLLRKSRVGRGRVQNASGLFVPATTATVEAACLAVEHSLPHDFRLSITNAPGKGSYPVASFTWIYVPTSGTSPARRRAVKQFLTWSLQNGQDVATTLGYAPLSPRVLSDALSELGSLH